MLRGCVIYVTLIIQYVFLYWNIRINLLFMNYRRSLQSKEELCFVLLVLTVSRDHASLSYASQILFMYVINSAKTWKVCVTKSFFVGKISFTEQWFESNERRQTVLGLVILFREPSFSNFQSSIKEWYTLIWWGEF